MYGDDDMRRYNSPINSSRSISNKPPTGRLQGLSSNNSYELSSNKKLSPIYDKSSYSNKKSGKRSDDEENDNNDDNDFYKSNKSSTKNRFNSDSNDENDKKKYNTKIKSKYNDYDDDEEEEKNKNIKKKISARDEKYSDNENSNDDVPKRSFKSSYDIDLGEKKTSKLDTSSTKLGNLYNRNNYEDFDADNYKNKTKLPSKNFDEYSSNKKLTDSFKLEQDVQKEYEKLTKYDDFKLPRSSQEKLSLKSPKTSEPVSFYNRDNSYNSKAAIPLPPGPNRATSLDRVGMFNSAYNTTNSLTSSTGKNKYNSSNNLNHFETMSDKSTGSRVSNLSIREAKSRYNE
jgi:hypothetical protein